MDGHAAIDTDALLEIAVNLAGLDATPPDSGVLYPGVGIRKVLLGHELGAAELLLARQQGFDAVIAHQPFGMPDAWRAAEAHVDALVRAGVPGPEAEAAVAPALDVLAIQSLSHYSERLAALARLLDVPLLVIHRPIDEIARQLLQERVDSRLAERPDAPLADLAATIGAMPEFAAALSAVQVAFGDAAAPAGRTLVSAGALAAGQSIAAAYFRHGVDTLISGPIVPEDLAALHATGRGRLVLLGSSLVAGIGLRAYAACLESLGIEVAALIATA